MAKKTRWEGLLLALNGDWWTSNPPAADDPTCFLTVPVRAVLRAGQAARARGYRIDEIRISPPRPPGTIEARVNAALLALDGAGDAARSIEYGGPLPLMAYQRTQLTEAVALFRGGVLLLPTALR